MFENSCNACMFCFSILSNKLNLFKASPSIVICVEKFILQSLVQPTEWQVDKKPKPFLAFITKNHEIVMNAGF